MTNDATKKWGEISKTAIKSMKELGNINTKIIEKLTEQQLAILDTCMEASKKEIEMATTSKNMQNPQSLLTAQAELASEYNNRLMSIVQSTGEILKNCSSEVTHWTDKFMGFEKRSTSTTIKKTAKKKSRKKTKSRNK